MSATREQIKQLAKEIPYKWKPQSVKYGKATMVAYVDARDIQNLFDDAVGPENWQVNYSIVDKQMFANIGIKVLHEDGTSEWIWKSDGGTESNVEQEKGLISDCFKRAAVTWSAGRFLYDLEIVELPAKEYKGKERPTTYEGEILWNNDEINEYIRSGMNKKSSTKQDSKRAKNYSTPTTEPTYSTVEYKEKTIKRVTSLKKDNLSGKECLKKYIPDYNTKFKTNYTQIIDFNSDELLNKLIDFIESIPPEKI